ncbi:hypothetical protein ACMATS_06085 [Streptoverticillium reticulum]|uniref:hypothetical protein n=1 Tax=Streptoverticillium reticulum TaxID=1433415 RepID=UPI0039BF2B04
MTAELTSDETHAIIKWEVGPAVPPNVTKTEKIELKRIKPPPPTTATVDADDSPYQWPDALEPGKEYQFEVTAIDADGNRSRPVKTGTVKPEAGRPDPPVNLRSTGQTSTTIDLAWDEP